MLDVQIGWLDRRARDAISYPIEENRLLRRQLGGRRLRLTDGDRRRLAGRVFRLGREILRKIAPIATPDTCPEDLALSVYRILGEGHIGMNGRSSL